MKRGLLLCSLFLLIFAFSSIKGSVYINEVMPHSNNSWQDEWLELYNPENFVVNLTNWTISDLNSNDTFSLTINPRSYALIVDSNTNKDNLTGCQSFNISNESCFELTTIGSGLNDGNETIFLFDNQKNLTDSFSWTENIKSIGKSWGLNLSTWLKCAQSPGLSNICAESNNRTNNESQENQTNELEEESSIKITDSPSKAKFGEEIDLKVEVYRGSTNKYALYIYVQDKNKKRVSEKKTLHLEEKYSEYRKKVSLELNCLENSGNYKIIAEGLDDKDTESIYIESCYEPTTEKISVNSSNQIIQNKTNDLQQTFISPYSKNLLTGSAIENQQDNSFLIILAYSLGAITIILILFLIYKRL